MWRADSLGTSSIVSTSYPFLPHLHLLSSIVETVVQLRELGHRVVLCSSGAIGVGLRRMGLKERGKGLSQKQALAAVGQGRLIALWDNLFSQLDQPIAQILLTRTDIADRTRYLNAQNTFSELLNMGVVPIVNENDTVSVSEIKFGDNDTLSAISSAIVHADYLFLLTDVECLYTDNPRNNPDAKPVYVVRDIEKVKQSVSTSTLGTSLGTGGMSTKLIAADLATAAGVTTVIMHSEHVRDVFAVIKDGPGPARDYDGVIPGEVEGGEVGVRCTRFLRREVALKDRKWWIAHGLHASGSVVIDEGAYRAIRKRESGHRVLPAGVVRIEGVFASSQAVRLLVRRRRRTADLSQSHQSGRSSIDDNSSRPPRRSGSKRGSSSALANELGHSDVDTETEGEGRGVQRGRGSEPETPTILPAASMSSSIASLDPLNRAGSASPALPSGASGGMGMGMSTMKEEGEGQEDGRDDGQGEWEEVDVGKGLALYNSMEMERIKGMKSSHIGQILGYCESEHVVDSITFW
ncbi:putative glutamate 5-kinase [Dioszegia hungarica]|uniref:Glutamate 5-kinase n=1 Tax=Dioszegia hungarica TaxID=4972 RepID=A0AA38LTS4_9TREE|nr:putative glutamate 5-kinase [Dioszegia hungarica]KAI9632881.1 putative glutamate 5-kinase [Dioszegia hungarica]